MRTPIFLRPLLLIGHYYRLWTQNFTSWLIRSNEEIFGPLEQMVVAVVIIGLAMNPELLPQFSIPNANQYQPPGYQGYPVPVPVLVPVPAQPPQSLPQKRHSPIPPNIPITNTNTSSPSSTEHPWLDVLPDALIFSPITLSLIILFISIAIHAIPGQLLPRLKESWRVFWPPWQDRSVSSSRSQGAIAFTGTRSDSATVPTDSSTNRLTEGIARSSSREPSSTKTGSSSTTAPADPSTSRPAEARATSNIRDPDDTTKSRSSSPTAPVDPSPSRSKDIKTTSTSREPDGTKAKATATPGSSARNPEEEKARKQALLDYEAKKAAKAAEEAKKGASEVKVQVADGLDKSDKTRSEKARSVKSDSTAVVTAPFGTEKEKPKDGATVTDKSAASRDSDEASTGTAPTGDEDPLMAGDCRPLKSILKKSSKKPRQSKNIHHNYFMGMRGHQAHLIPFPHGLHPPPQGPRHSLWWKNIPKDASHMMAPPPVPKEVKDVLEGEEVENERVSDKADKGSSSSKDRDRSKTPSDDKDKEREKEKARARAEAEAKEKEKERERAKQKMKEASSSSREPGTATAKVSIESPPEPDAPVDPQVQKATWASQAMLCLLLFYIQQQLGLILLVFFIWQQLNSRAAQQVPRDPKAPIATATATAEARPPPRLPAPVVADAVPAPKTDTDIPPDMLEKLARAKAAKKRAEEEASRSKGEDGSPARAAEPTKVAKGKEKALPDPASKETGSRPKDPKGAAAVGDRSRSSAIRPPSADMRVDKGKRKADPEPVKGDASEKNPSMAAKTAPRALSADERAAYRSRKAAQSVSGSPEASLSKTDKNGDEAAKAAKRAKWDAMSEEEKRKYLAEKERRHKDTSQAKAKTPEQAKKERWEKLTDEEKKQYLTEREKRKAAAEASDPKAAAESKREKWDKMSDSEKERYLQERKKRQRAKVASKKLGEGSGLTAEEKANL